MPARKASLHGVALVMLSACRFDLPAAAPSGDAPGGGDAPIADAATDAVADAGPFVCSFPGAQCPGGVPLQVLPCGTAGECWVGCVNGAVQTPVQAMQFCMSLGMTIGAFDSAAEETCVRGAGINGGIMLGIMQLADQATPGDGWLRIAGNTPVQYFNWDTGMPNDGPTAGEDNEEQCAFSNTSAQWHDIPCTTAGSARWICRHP